MILALECLHTNGVIYRDLKPENILVDSEGHLRITDFGLSKIKETEEEVAFSFCGTPEYIAPEIIRGAGYGKEIDYWSLGLIIYEMLSGINPFKQKGLNKYQKIKMVIESEILMFDIFSKNTCSLLQGLLKKDPKKRLGSGKTGIQEIKKHAFFKKIDWDALLNKKVEPPYKPQVTSEMDINNIDNFFLKQKVAETPETGSIILDNYESFSYYNKDNVPLEGNNYNSVMLPNEHPQGNNSFDDERPASHLRQSQKLEVTSKLTGKCDLKMDDMRFPDVPDTPDVIDTEEN